MDKLVGQVSPRSELWGSQHLHDEYHEEVEGGYGNEGFESIS